MPYGAIICNNECLKELHNNDAASNKQSYVTLVDFFYYQILAMYTIMGYIGHVENVECMITNVYSPGA